MTKPPSNPMHDLGVTLFEGVGAARHALTPTTLAVPNGFDWPTGDEFPLLRTVYPYGGTMFTSWQMQWLIPELEALAARTQQRTDVHAAQDTAALLSLLTLARRCGNEDGTNLWCTGA